MVAQGYNEVWVVSNVARAPVHIRYLVVGALVSCIRMTSLARYLWTEGDSHSSLPQSSLELIKSNLQEDNADEVNNMNSVFGGHALRSLKAHWPLSTCCMDAASDTSLKTAPSSLKADFIDPLILTGAEEEGTQGNVSKEGSGNHWVFSTQRDVGAAERLGRAWD